MRGAEIIRRAADTLDLLEPRGECDLVKGPLVRNEESSSGIDEFLQGLGGDQPGTNTSTALRVPPAPFALPAGSGQLGVGRYLFQLCSAKIGGGRRVRVRGARQLLTIGASATGPTGLPYILEQPVVTTNWRFSDGNVAWMMLVLKARQKPLNDARNADNFTRRFNEASAAGALLYENFVAPAKNLRPTGAPDYYTSITQYVPPMVPLGDPFAGSLGLFRDLRFPWQTSNAWRALDIVVEGPCTIAMFASVRQTNPTARPKPPAAWAPPPSMPEEQFLAQVAALGGSVPAGGASYWRIGGALNLEEVA